MEKVFLNNALVDADKACVRFDDIGFLYGGGVFETMRSRNGVVFRLEDHLNRLIDSADALSIRNSYDKEYVTDAVYQVLRANELKDARLRLTLTSGPMTGDPEKMQSTLVITALKLPPYPAEYYDNGIMVVICPFKQNLIDPVYGHKTLNYYPRILALNIAKQRGAAEAIWFTVDNRLAEGCISNIFMVKDSILYTPPTTTPVLAGVARKTVCELAEQNSIELVEKDLNINDLLEADEVFMTNVIMKVMPVNSIEKHVVGNGKKGKITEQLQKYFDEFIEKQCGEEK